MFFFVFHLTSIVVRVIYMSFILLIFPPTLFLSPEGNTPLQLGILMARESLAPGGRLLQ
jgi:hypothetical protein